LSQKIAEDNANIILEMLEDYDHNPYCKNITSTAMNRLFSITDNHHIMKKFQLKKTK